MFTIDDVKEVRARSGHGLAACKNALEEIDNNDPRVLDKDERVEFAVKLLTGKANYKPRAGKETSQGCIFSYTHHTSQMAAMVEINCETDFAAKSIPFRTLGENIAMQVAAMDPTDMETLFNTPSILDSKMTVKHYFDSVQVVLGENIVIRRFLRWSLGE